MIKQQMFRGFALLAGACLLSACALAQGVEIAGYGGGVTFGSGGGTHPTVGGSVGYNIGENLLVFGEFGYIPFGSASADTSFSGVNIHASASEKFVTYGGGVNYSFTPRSSKIRPYMLVGLGGVRDSISGSGSGGSVNVNLSTSSNGWYFGLGGGVRIYAGKNWGVKPEFRYQRIGDSSGSSGNTFSYTAGVFYEFGAGK